MKVRYIGPSFGVDGLTNGKVYTCLGVEYGALRDVDDSDEDYLYSALRPGPAYQTDIYGKWEIIEDDNKGSLYNLICG